jgi:hypothetical protein
MCFPCRTTAILLPATLRAANAALVEETCLLPCFDTQHVPAVLKRVKRHHPENAMRPDALQDFGEARCPGAHHNWSKQLRKNGSQGWIRTTDLTVNNRSLYH